MKYLAEELQNNEVKFALLSVFMMIKFHLDTHIIEP